MHVIHKGGTIKGAMWVILFLMKAISVWFIGIGIKLTLYDVDAPADAFYAHDQRLLLGTSAGSKCVLARSPPPPLLLNPRTYSLPLFGPTRWLRALTGLYTTQAPLAPRASC